MGALGLVLLLVCANVANLVLVRAQSRRQEFAIRAALGAGWERIARELMVESLILGILGGALGLVLAYFGVRVLVTQGPATLPRLAEISTDGTALAFALACSLGSSLLFGLAAVLRSSIPDRIESARGATQGAKQLRAQNALVVTQVALAFVLLVASGLIIRSFLALRAVTEVSIRLALGAEPRVLKWFFVRKGLILNCIGGILGLALAGGLSRSISSLLFGIKPLDPLTYIASGALIVTAAMAASYVPARKAASVDPMETLRGE